MLVLSWFAFCLLILGVLKTLEVTEFVEKILTSSGLYIPVIAVFFLKTRLWWVFPAIALGFALLITGKTSYPEEAQPKLFLAMVSIIGLFAVTCFFGAIAIFFGIVNQLPRIQ